MAEVLEQEGRGLGRVSKALGPGGGGWGLWGGWSPEGMTDGRKEISNLFFGSAAQKEIP